MISSSKRQGIVDLWRLIACLLIMTSHCDFLGGLEVGYYPLSAARIFVEFFLFLRVIIQCFILKNMIQVR